MGAVLRMENQAPDTVANNEPTMPTVGAVPRAIRAGCTKGAMKAPRGG